MYKRQVNDCGVNRKTFYYHFEDIYALLRWIFEEEALNIVKQLYLINDYDGAMDFIVEYIDKNRAFMRNAYDAFGSVELGNFFRKSTLELTRQLIKTAEESMKRRLTPETEDYLCEFLTEAATGVLLSNIAGTLDFGKGRFTKPIRNIMRASIVGVLTEEGIPCEPAEQEE